MDASSERTAVAALIRGRAPFFFVEVDHDGTVRDTNAFTESMLGRPLVGTPFKDIFIDAEGAMNVLALSPDPSRRHRVDVAPSRGLPQTIECTFHVTDDRILAIGHLDITGMEALQREFIGLNNELNAVTRQLQKANAQLEQLNDLKNRFVGFAAHDLRKPVGVIQTYTEFLIDEARASLGQEHREFLDLIHDRARTMTRLIEELLDIAMIESGRNQADLQPADLARILRTACLSVKTVADAKRVTIHLAVDPALPALSFDALKIEQTVVNLLSNAVEHTRPETTVRVWARRAGAEVVVSVTDQGPGIPPSVKETLFQPFARGQTQKADGQDSHGLGLAIAKRMVEAHQGRIWAESASGEGATFAFALPLQRHDPIAKGQPR